MKKINLLLGTSRSGSSPLARILHECGANFGSDVDTDAPEHRGYFESKAFDSSVNWFMKYNQLRETLPFIPVRFLRSFHKKGAKIFAREIQKRNWAKSSNLAECVDQVSNSKYLRNVDVRILAIIRPPGENVRSQVQRWLETKHPSFRGNLTEFCYNKYYKANVNLTEIIKHIKGCIVLFPEIRDKKESAWAYRIAKAFPEFQAEDLLKARDKIIDSRTINSGKSMFIPEKIKKLWDYMGKEVKNEKIS